MTAEARRALARVGLTIGEPPPARPGGGAGPYQEAAAVARPPRGRVRTAAREINRLAPRSGPARGPAAALLADAVGSYLDAVRATGRSAATVATYRRALGCFLAWAAAARPGAACADLDHALADAYVSFLRDGYRAQPSGKGLRLSDRSVHLYVKVLKAFARWGARGRRYWRANPLAEYPTPVFTEGEIVALTRVELAALLAAAGPATSFAGLRLRAMLLLALDTGLRRGELRGLTLPMLDLAEGRVRLPGAITKTHRPRAVHVQRVAAAALRGWLDARAALPGVPVDAGPLFCTLDGAPLSEGALDELAVRLRRRSGVARFRWHLLRHTAGTESLRNGPTAWTCRRRSGTPPAP